MQGYVARKGQQWYAVVYAGMDPATGRERRRWHAAGTDRGDAERLARQLAREERARRGQARSRLSFAGFVARHWLPAKKMQLLPTTIEGYERMLRLHILTTLGAVPLGQVRADAVQNLYGRLLLEGRHDGAGGLSPKTVHEVHTVVRNILDDAVRRGMRRQPRPSCRLSPLPPRSPPPPQGLDRRGTAHVPRSDPRPPMPPLCFASQFADQFRGEIPNHWRAA